MKIVIIDYGLCNLLSVHNALKSFGIDSLVSPDPEPLADADAVILPGVGAFEDGMKGLRSRGFVGPVREFVQSGRPFLGICLGMQLLMDKSYEFGEHEGLGLVSGEVSPLERADASGQALKIPHIGWNGLWQGGRPWPGTLLADLSDGTEMYFVHSFRVVPKDPAHVLAWTSYGGRRFCSVVAKANVYGCQFHPEKSSVMGLSILKRFIGLKKEVQYV